MVAGLLLRRRRRTSRWQPPIPYNMSGTIKSTRQFTKRRVQSPLVQQQVNGIPTMAGNTPISASSPVQAQMTGYSDKASPTPSTALAQGVTAIQSSTAPLHVQNGQSTDGHSSSGHQHDQANDMHHSLDQDYRHNDPLCLYPHSHHDHAHENIPHDHARDHLDHDHYHGYTQQDLLDHHHHYHHRHDHHHHQRSYAPVHTPQLPSWSEIFSTLTPMQKTVFTWFSIHILIGMSVWWAGVSKDNLAIVGYSYLVVFDALGVLNLFVSDVVRTNPAFLAQNTKRPFGARRYEVVFAMAITVYLLFATMYTTKESLEHMLTEDDDDDHHENRRLGFSGFFIILLSIGATFLSSVSLRNHDQFVRYLRRSPTTVHGFSYNVLNRARGSAFSIVLSNIYSLSIFACGAGLLVLYAFGMVSPFMDKFAAFGESAVMFYLGGPTAAALAKLLLQTTPDAARAGIEARLNEIRQDPNIIALDRIHFWQNSYGKCVGTVEVQVRPEADETSVLQFVYQKLEGLTSTDAADLGSGQTTRSELTVSIVK